MQIKLLFNICGSRFAKFVYDLGAKTHISDVHFLLSDLYFITKAKMDVILPVYNKNNDLILNTKHIKAC